MYQAVRLSHRQNDNSSNDIATFLNLLTVEALTGSHQLTIISVTLLKRDWGPRNYEMLDWEVLIWSPHHWTDDELYPLRLTTVEED